MNAVECKRCLYSTRHPFGLTINLEGLCSGCITHEEKSALDWETRRDLLKQRLPRLLGNRSKRDYDCVVPVRGTPEYFQVLDIVKSDLGLNPLVVSYNSQFNSHVGIRNFDLLRETFDVDVLHYTSNPLIYRKLIRDSLARFHSMRWPFIAGETQLPVQVAVDKQIPLIIWPFHQPTEQVGTHSYVEENEMTRRSRHEFDLMGCEPHELLTNESLLEERDIQDIEYPSDALLRKSGVRGIYLSNFYPWDTRAYSERMVDRYGAACAKTCRTFDTYDRIDDMTYMTVHDVLKEAKLGYSRVTDNLCREIRFGRISRSDARNIEAYYQSEMPREEIEKFCNWLGISWKGFSWLVSRLPMMKRSKEPVALRAAQEAFIAAFSSNASPVWTSDNYIVFGKGLDVDRNAPAC